MFSECCINPIREFWFIHLLGFRFRVLIFHTRNRLVFPCQFFLGGKGNVLPFVGFLIPNRNGFRVLIQVIPDAVVNAHGVFPMVWGRAIRRYPLVCYLAASALAASALATLAASALVLASALASALATRLP